MKNYARIEKNTVRELFSTEDDITELFHPSIQWVDITECEVKPEEGWEYAKGIFVPPRK